jgi:hypothetical protein
MAYFIEPSISLLVWTWFRVVSLKQQHSIFKKVFSSQIIMEQLISSASLDFAPDLFDVTQTSTPPILSYFQNLPTVAKGRFGQSTFLYLRNRAADQRLTSAPVLKLKAVLLYVFAQYDSMMRINSSLAMYRKPFTTATRLFIKAFNAGCPSQVPLSFHLSGSLFTGSKLL